MSKGLAGPQIESYSVGAWCPSPDGTGKPTAVGLSFKVSGFGDLVVRLKTPERVDEMIAQLLQYKQEVWPEVIGDGQHRHGQ